MKKPVAENTINIDSVLSEDMKVYMSLTKKELALVIQKKNDLLIEAFNELAELRKYKKGK